MVLFEFQGKFEYNYLSLLSENLFKLIEKENNQYELIVKDIMALKGKLVPLKKKLLICYKDDNKV